MRVLGVDPGTQKAGLAVIEGGRRLVSEQLQIGRSEMSMVQRVGRLFARVRLYARRYELSAERGDCIALEAGFVGHNPQAALAIGLARGAVLAAAAVCGLEVRMIHPATVKLVTGRGNATKERVQLVMMQILKPGRSLGEDEADACAIALAGEAEAREAGMAARYRQAPVIKAPARPRRRTGA